jgi:hypothetical protein
MQIKRYKLLQADQSIILDIVELVLGNAELSEASQVHKAGWYDGQLILIKIQLH